MYPSLAAYPRYWVSLSSNSKFTRKNRSRLRLQAWWTQIDSWRSRDCLKYDRASTIIKPQWVIESIGARDDVVDPKTETLVDGLPTFTARVAGESDLPRRSGVDSPAGRPRRADPALLRIARRVPQPPQSFWRASARAPSWWVDARALRAKREPVPTARTDRGRSERSETHRRE